MCLSGLALQTSTSEILSSWYTVEGLLGPYKAVVVPTTLDTLPTTTAVDSLFPWIPVPSNLDAVNMGVFSLYQQQSLSTGCHLKYGKKSVTVFLKISCMLLFITLGLVSTSPLSHYQWNNH